MGSWSFRDRGFILYDTQNGLGHVDGSSLLELSILALDG
jgi:hypothetical protein